MSSLPDLPKHPECCLTSGDLAPAFTLSKDRHTQANKSLFGAFEIKHSHYYVSHISHRHPQIVLVRNISKSMGVFVTNPLLFISALALKSL